MRRNLIAVIAYPIVFWLILGMESFLTTILGLHSAPKGVSNLFFVLPFLISPVASGWIASSRHILSAIFGSLLHQILIIISAPILLKLLLRSNDVNLQRILASLPQVDIYLATATLQILSVIFLPVVILLAIIGGFIGAKIRKFRFQPNLVKPS